MEKWIGKLLRFIDVSRKNLDESTKNLIKLEEEKK